MGRKTIIGPLLNDYYNDCQLKRLFDLAALDNNAFVDRSLRTSRCLGSFLVPYMYYLLLLFYVLFCTKFLKRGNVTDRDVTMVWIFPNGYLMRSNFPKSLDLFERPKKLSRPFPGNLAFSQTSVELGDGWISWQRDASGHPSRPSVPPAQTKSEKGTFRVIWEELLSQIAMLIRVGVQVSRQQYIINAVPDCWTRSI